MNELRLPWKDNVDEVIDAGKDIVMDGYCSSFQGHIDFIIKAVNNHDALVEELQELSAAIHYPECWDTMAYPTLLSALTEIGCNAEHEGEIN